MIRGSKRPIDGKTTPTAVFNASIHNRFDIEVVDSITGSIKRRAKGYNVICDQLWKKLLSSSTYFNYIQYGGGSGTPSSADTSLFSYISGQKVEDGWTLNIDYTNGVASVKRKIQLTAATAVGSTITEVGIAYDSGSTTLCTHAMLVDMNGNTVSIEKKDTDVVNIYATIFIHFNPKGYGGGGIRIFRSGVNTRATVFNFIAGISGTMCDKYWARSEYRISTISSGLCPNNAESGYTAGVTYSYDVANKKVIGSIPRLEASGFNMGGIRNIYIGYYGESISNSYADMILRFRVGDSWFPYSEITSEAVGTGDGSTVDFALDFPYAHDAKVYIDGVETTNFTLDYGPHTTDARYHVEALANNATDDNHIPAEVASCSSFTGSRILYNPAHGIGIKTMYIGANIQLYASNDLSSWILVTDATTSDRGTYAMPSEYAHYKYYKGVNTSGTAKSCYASSFIDTYTDKKLHFTTPPASGAAITAGYKTDTIAKDVNHVFDMSFEIQFNEYTEG